MQTGGNAARPRKTPSFAASPSGTIRYWIMDEKNGHRRESAENGVSSGAPADHCPLHEPPCFSVCSVVYLFFQHEPWLRLRPSW